MNEELKFDSKRIPEKRLTTITAYINEATLLSQGKRFLHEVLADLVRRSVVMYRGVIEKIVNDVIMSKETEEYVKSQIHEKINEAIKAEIEDMFKKEK